jgi:hypothetical protein
VIADYAPLRSATTPASADEPADDLTDVAVVWALLNTLDAVEIEPADAPFVRAAQQSFRRRIEDLAVAPVDLFEHLADAVERGDWASLGLEEPD